MKTIIKKVNSIIIVITVLGSQPSCEEKQIIVLPNGPEKLYVAAILDADDTIKTIKFIKSWQLDYPYEAKDSIRGLSFTLSSSETGLFSYQSIKPLKNEITLPLPTNLKFENSTTYFFKAIEDITGEIETLITVPARPPEFKLDSMKKVVYINNNYPAWANPAMKAKLYFTIEKVDADKSYFTIVIDGYTNFSGFNDNYITYSVLSSNIPYFVEGIPTFITHHMPFYSVGQPLLIYENCPAMFFSLQKGKGEDNKISISLEMGGEEIYDFKKPVRIRLLSITEEMYNFVKSTYTFHKTWHDPFQDPVYIKTNIDNGYGIFSICRSREIKTILPWE